MADVPRSSLVTRSTDNPAALFRSPRRITVTLAHHTYEQLQQRCDREGRSLSNLAAFLLEVSLQEASEGVRLRSPHPLPPPPAIDTKVRRSCRQQPHSQEQQRSSA